MEVLFAYARASSLDLSTRRLTLATTATSLAGKVGSPARDAFFDGFLVEPAPAATGLRQVAYVAGATYHDREQPPFGADPLVTSDGTQLRFESFSRCGGVLARLDVLPEGLDGAFLTRGTTNVDVNEPLRRLLTRVAPGDFLHLDVGAESMHVTTPNEVAIERKVPLSERWLRGLAEAQASGSHFDVRAELSGIDALRFLQGLPRRAQGWLVQGRGSWRLSSRPVPGAVWLSRSDRIEAVLPLLHLADRVRLFGPHVSASQQTAPSVWVVDLATMRFVLHLSDAPARGFSGEGSILDSIAVADGAAGDADTLARLLDHHAVLDLADLAARAQLSDERARAAVAFLAAAGRVGYDVADASWFHRDLPFDATTVERLNPRLRRAEALVACGAVVLVSDTQADVDGTGTTHRVRRGPDDAESCTCQWWTTHQGARGPCAHVLAARLARVPG